MLRVAMNNPAVARIRTTSATIAPAGTPPPELGAQNSVPVRAARCEPTSIGTRQSNTFVRLPLSFTCGGVAPFDIQWMRWSCISNRPVLLTNDQFGGAFGPALLGTGVPP